ncbi:hypothetical protein ACF0H5_010141 [Mactra antiquata]
MDDSSSVQLPPDDAKWLKNNFKEWPRLVYEDLDDYFIMKKAYDGKEMRCDDYVPKPQQFIDHIDLKEFANKCSVKSLWECKGSMLNRVLTAPKKTVIEKMPLQHGCHEVDSDGPAFPACTPCKQFF